MKLTLKVGEYSMDCAEYTNSMLNIILAVAERVPENSIQVKMDYLYKNNENSIYIYSTDINSNIIRLLPYAAIQNSYSSWIALGGGNSAFLSMLTEFIVRLCGAATELYLNTILDMMEVPVNDSDSN
jgi:hypothetical protein